MTKLSYQKPTVMPFGTVADLTRASFNNAQADSIFLNGVIVGSGHGSLDACISLDPTNPAGNCDVPTP